MVSCRELWHLTDDSIAFSTARGLVSAGVGWRREGVGTVGPVTRVHEERIRTTESPAFPDGIPVSLDPPPKSSSKHVGSNRIG